MSSTARRLHFKQLASVREVLIVSHREPRVTLHRRDDEVWTALEAWRGATLEVASLAARITVDELYRDGLEDAQAIGSHQLSVLSFQPIRVAES